MTGATLTLPTLSNPRTFLSEMIARDREAFVILCNKNFDSADDMAGELALVGFSISEKRCQRIRNRKAKKIYHSERRAVRFVLKRRHALKQAAETKAEIARLQARIKELEAL